MISVSPQECVRREHISRLGWALFVSDHWYNSWIEYKNSHSDRLRRFAIMCKAKSIINYDSLLCCDKRLFLEERLALANEHGDHTGMMIQEAIRATIPENCK